MVTKVCRKADWLSQFCWFCLRMKLAEDAKAGSSDAGIPAFLLDSI